MLSRLTRVQVTSVMLASLMRVHEPSLMLVQEPSLMLA
jgi:hypothetical protein